MPYTEPGKLAARAKMKAKEAKAVPKQGKVEAEAVGTEAHCPECGAAMTCPECGK